MEESLSFNTIISFMTKTKIQETGKIIIENNSIIFVIIVGFSKGVAELAPKNPPPFVPKCLIDSNAAIGPDAIS